MKKKAAYSLGYINLQIKLPKKQSPKQVGKVKNPSLPPYFRCRRQLLKFHIFEGTPATLFDFYGESLGHALFNLEGRCFWAMHKKI